MRATLTQTQVAEHLLAATEPVWGYGLRKELRIKSGVLYPILARMTVEGWLVRERETDPPDDRPPRWYYVVTETGREHLSELVARRKAYG